MCEINYSEYDALIDSGASSNYMRSDIFNLTRESVKCFVEQTQVIRLANTSTIRSLGKATITFIIIEELSYDLILGINFIFDNNLVIDGESNIIYFGSNEENLHAAPIRLYCS